MKALEGFTSWEGEELMVFIPAYLVCIHSALLRAANNKRGNNGYLVTPLALKASHQ